MIDVVMNSIYYEEHCISRNCNLFRKIDIDYNLPPINQKNILDL